MAPMLELCCGTVRQASLPQLIEAAAQEGFGAITVNPDMLREAGVGAQALKAQLRDAGVRVTNVDGFGSGLPGIPTGEGLAPFRNYNGRDVSRTLVTPEDDFYRTAEALDASSINMVHFGGDPATPLAALAEATAAICARAAGHGLGIVVEFIPENAIATLAIAARLVDEVGAPNLSITFDPRHWARSGGTVADVARHAGLVGAIQLNDLNWATKDDPERLLPGEGELPLVEALRLIRKARPDTPVGVEVFNDVLVAMTPREAARTAGRSLRMIVEAAEA